MTYGYYLALIDEYINTECSLERLCAEIGYPPNAPSEDDYLKSISIIAAAANGDIKKIVALSGLKMAGFAKKFVLPYRSLQNWCDGSRTPPSYLPILIGFILVSELWASDTEDI